MRTTFDMAPFARSLIGFDRIIDQFQAQADPDQNDNYPSFDIEKIGDNRYRIVLAVAGFNEKQLAVGVEANQLTVTGEELPTDDKETLYRGIPHCPFIRRFTLADFVVVKESSLANGLLTIELEQQLPEAMKPRRIIINNVKPTVTDSRHAA